MWWRPIARVYEPLKAGSIDSTDTVPHDRAVIRAMKAEYYPNQLVSGNPRNTVFVARLSLDTTEEHLREVFSVFGEIQKLRLVRDVVTGFSKRYAFVEYKDRLAAQRAYQHGHKMIVENREVLVEMEAERTIPGWVPRRLGGGWGGRKESGQLRFGGRVRPFRKPILIKNPEDDPNPRPEHFRNEGDEDREDYKYRRYPHHHSRQDEGQDYRSHRSRDPSGTHGMQASHYRSRYHAREFEHEEHRSGKHRSYHHRYREFQEDDESRGSMDRDHQRQQPNKYKSHWKKETQDDSNEDSTEEKSKRHRSHRELKLEEKEYRDSADREYQERNAHHHSKKRGHDGLSAEKREARKKHKSHRHHKHSQPSSRADSEDALSTTASESISLAD